jgi:hypothetical protein
VKKVLDKSHFIKREDAAFAQAVITIHDRKLFGDPLNDAVLRETLGRWNDVHKTATALIMLRKLADREPDRVLSKKDGLHQLGKSGLREAIALLDALATGTRHPIYDHSRAFNRRRLGR